MVKGFRDFLMRGNVVELAVAVIIGVAFGGIVDSLSKDIISPMIASLGGQPDFSTLKLGPLGDRQLHERRHKLPYQGGSRLLPRRAAVREVRRTAGRRDTATAERGIAARDPRPPGQAPGVNGAADHAPDKAPDHTPALLVSGLRKAYGDVVAVDGLDLEVRRGECFGLLGSQRCRQDHDHRDRGGPQPRRCRRDRRCSAGAGTAAPTSASCASASACSCRKRCSPKS